MSVIKGLILIIAKYPIILIILLLMSGCQKKKCNDFYFSDAVLESVPKKGSKYDVGFENTLQAEVIQVVIDSIDYAVTTPLKYQECESIILISYAIEDYTMTARLSKTENETNLFCAIAGINLSKHIEFADEDAFLNSEYQAFRLNDMNDTIMSIHLKGLKIEKITQKQ